MSAREKLAALAARHGARGRLLRSALDEVEREAAEKALREAAATVRARAPKYLETAEDIAVFLALDKAAALIEPDKEG